MGKGRINCPHSRLATTLGRVGRINGGQKY
jgi:hypothetical protein